MGCSQTFEWKVIAVWIFQEHPFSILSVSIFYSPEWDKWVKSYGNFNLPGTFVSNFERLDILWFVIRHSSQKLWPFQFAISFCVQSLASRYIMVHNQTFESKVMPVWICSEHPQSISRVSIYCGPQSDIHVKSYASLNLLEASVINFEGLDILSTAFKHLSQKLW